MRELTSVEMEKDKDWELITRCILITVIGKVFTLDIMALSTINYLLSTQIIMLVGCLPYSHIPGPYSVL